MDYLNEIPEHLVIKITECEDLAKLKSMKIRYHGPKNVWIRLTIDERMTNIKSRSVN